ncbi:MAG TPA: DUF4265 domain-containing protein [Anaeromyxobacter sp.]|nr:DUF4265 domain-containing protein [Anaeromyxobacter sp.]
MPTDLDAAEGLVRIRIVLDRAPDEAGPAEDSVWAEPLGSERFRVESCPFFAYGLSRDDVVRAAGPQGAGAPVLEDVLEKSGHRTLRLALADDAALETAPVQRLLERLVELACTHELLRPRLVAIDVPAVADLGRVAEVLQEAAGQGVLVWEWADPRPS